jgi:predicted DNA-binding transcriptional regulator AlpA
MSQQVSSKVLPDSGFVRLPTVLAVFPVSRSTWWAGIQNGKYPPGIKLSERVTAWKVEDIRALLAKFAGAGTN